MRMERTHSLSGDNISFTADGNVAAVVSFTIAPVFIDGEIAAVCINDVAPADKLKIITDDDDDD